MQILCCIYKIPLKFYLRNYFCNLHPSFLWNPSLLSLKSFMYTWFQKGAFNNYVDSILLFLTHSLRGQFLYAERDKNRHFLNPSPTPHPSSYPRSHWMPQNAIEERQCKNRSTKEKSTIKNARHLFFFKTPFFKRFV